MTVDIAPTHMKDLQAAVTSELVKRFEASGLPATLVDVWTDQLIKNSCDPEIVDGSPMPVYRVSGPRQTGDIDRHEALWMVRRLAEEHEAVAGDDPRNETLGHALSLWSGVLARIEAGEVVSERPTGQLHTI